MQLTIHRDRVRHTRSELLYGHFLEHFHRQIYGGVFDPLSRFADEDGFRADVLDAMRKIKVPIIRWPGGCFVSSYHWRQGVEPSRTPSFDKAWRVEEPNTFGTDEFIKLCRKVGCEPYICTNAGTGNAEEMSDWLEYCNLESEGAYARLRVANGYSIPHAVKYWSIGNENYGNWEIGAKGPVEWSRLVQEASKMMKHTDPTVSLSAAALDDLDWNIGLLKAAHERLDWISLHGYWDVLNQVNHPSSYERCVGLTGALDRSIRRARGLLTAMGLENRIKIAYDEWNLRGWHHPNTHTNPPGVTRESYIIPRDLNDINATYTMADAVFSACFLNTLLRNADIVGMANFAPLVNTRGAIFTHSEGIVLRSTYQIFDLYVNYLYDQVLDIWLDGVESYLTPDGVKVDAVDVVATRNAATKAIAIAAVNKHPDLEMALHLEPMTMIKHITDMTMWTVDGNDKNDYNDVDRNTVVIRQNTKGFIRAEGETMIVLPPHSVNIIRITTR